MKVLIVLALASSAFGVILPVPAVPAVPAVTGAATTLGLGAPIASPYWGGYQESVFIPNYHGAVWQPTQEAEGVFPAFQPKYVPKSSTIWGGNQGWNGAYPYNPYGKQFPYGSQYPYGYPYYGNGLINGQFGNGVVRAIAA